MCHTEDARLLSAVFALWTYASLLVGGFRVVTGKLANDWAPCARRAQAVRALCRHAPNAECSLLRGLDRFVKHTEGTLTRQCTTSRLCSQRRCRQVRHWYPRSPTRPALVHLGSRNRRGTPRRPWCTSHPVHRRRQVLPHPPP